MMQELLTAFVQVYVALGLLLGTCLSLASRRRWYQAFREEDFHPPHEHRSVLALAGLIAIVLLWPSFLLHTVRRQMRRR